MARHGSGSGQRMLRARFARTLATLGILVVSLIAGPVAYGYWTGAGVGAGSAGSGTTVPLELSAGAVSAGLYPGGSANVTLTVKNSNAGPVRINRFSLNTALGTSGFTVESGLTTCALSFTADSTGWDIVARESSTVASTTSITLGGAILMGTGATSDCQGKSITVYLGADS
ncbi:hypothetical protein D6T64_17855 [Cryobacterium melibiosiphilum]|uniref:Uncharacterized protein n=2 Tax=Cryobacterium melibiosiphilum TaxID=995039 RepID=A0A3A5MI63_9MICO|nr:hypothetical protein D6T64_17855 [Cryobacterium melibiosiphilum]